MIKEEIKIYNDALALSEGFTELLKKLLEVYPHINLSLSGGSTPKALFDYWAANCKDSIAWERISFYWGDERCVTPDDTMSNYGMTKTHLFDKVPAIMASNIYRIKGENEPAKEAEAYGKILESNLLQRQNTPSFEVVMLGLGDDGHTVSVFPHQMDLWNSNENCIVAQHPDTGMKRVSISGKVVNNAQYTIFLVTGKNKAEKVRDIIRNRKQLLNVYPAARVNPVNGYLYWILDSEAASLL